MSHTHSVFLIPLDRKTMTVYGHSHIHRRTSSWSAFPSPRQRPLRTSGKSGSRKYTITVPVCPVS